MKKWEVVVGRDMQQDAVMAISSSKCEMDGSAIVKRQEAQLADVKAWIGGGVVVSVGSSLSGKLPLRSSRFLSRVGGQLRELSSQPSLFINNSTTTTMALNTTTRMLLRSRIALRNNWVCQSCQTIRYSSTDAPASPLLSKLKGDLKTAMKAKDTARLNVLRGVIAEVTNSAKTSSPIKTDMQLLSVLKKRVAAAKAAQQEFKAAGRDDLVEKEQQQVDVLDEYADSVETMGVEEIQNAVKAVVDQAKAAAQNAKINMGEVLKKVLGPGGSLEGKPVDRAEVARIVKQTLGQ